MATARIRDVSVAAILIAAPWSFEVALPVTNACTTMLMRFCTSAPAPVAATATTHPAIATEIASTRASMTAVLTASTVTSPPASMREFSMSARTCEGVGVDVFLPCQHLLQEPLR